MKLVLAIVPPHLVNHILDDIDHQHLHVLAISEARGFLEAASPGFGDTTLRPRMRVEVLCEDHEIQGLRERLDRTVRDDQRGHGRILVVPLEGTQDEASSPRDWAVPALA